MRSSSHKRIVVTALAVGSLGVLGTAGAEVFSAVAPPAAGLRIMTDECVVAVSVSEPAVVQASMPIAPNAPAAA